MSSQVATTTTKGMPVAAVRIGSTVQLWVSSPTGDSSDSFIFDIPCLSEAQATAVQASWASIIKVVSIYN